MEDLQQQKKGLHRSARTSGDCLEGVPATTTSWRSRSELLPIARFPSLLSADHRFGFRTNCWDRFHSAHISEGAVWRSLSFLPGFVFGSIGPAKIAKLKIRCVHSFAAADLSVWIDDKLDCETAMTGSVRNRLGLIKTVQGSFVDVVAAVPGKHLIRVRVISKAAGYDQTREVQAELRSESTKTLDIAFAGRSE